MCCVFKIQSLAWVDLISKPSDSIAICLGCISVWIQSKIVRSKNIEGILKPCCRIGLRCMVEIFCEILNSLRWLVENGLNETSNCFVWYSESQMCVSFIFWAIESRLINTTPAKIRMIIKDMANFIILTTPFQGFSCSSFHVPMVPSAAEDYTLGYGYFAASRLLLFGNN